MDADELTALRGMLADTAAQRDSFKEAADALTHEVVKVREQCDGLTSQLGSVEHEHNTVRSR